MRSAPALLVCILAFASPASGDCPDVDFSTFDTAPAMVDSTTPIVDRELVLMGVDGEYVVEVYVLADGSVCDALAPSASWSEKVTNVLVSEAKRRRFVPATRGGHPVPGVATATFDLEIRVVRNAPPVIDTAGPMVSDRAEDTRPTRCSVAAYHYDGIWVYGDLSIRDLDTLRALVAEFVDSDTFISRVYHFLVYPSVCRPGPEFAGDRPDLAVELSSEARGKTRKTMTRYFINEGGTPRAFPIMTLHSGVRPTDTETSVVDMVNPSEADPADLDVPASIWHEREFIVRPTIVAEVVVTDATRFPFVSPGSSGAQRFATQLNVDVLRTSFGASPNQLRVLSTMALLDPEVRGGKKQGVRVSTFGGEALSNFLALPGDTLLVSLTPAYNAYEDNHAPSVEEFAGFLVPAERVIAIKPDPYTGERSAFVNSNRPWLPEYRWAKQAWQEGRIFEAIQIPSIQAPESLAEIEAEYVRRAHEQTFRIRQIVKGRGRD